MQVEIREVNPRKAVCMSHRGPYEMIGQTFGALYAWLREAGVQPGQGVALYYDNPRVTPVDELRSDAGTFVPDDFMTDDPCVHVVEVAGGPYAVGTHVGPYSELTSAWRELVGEWLPSSGYEMAYAPCVEVYLNDCSEAPPDQLRTEICVPVKGAPSAANR